jgi:CubicO group peptidase (beta-lactamase class C family)
MAVRPYRGDYSAFFGQFGWDGGSGTATYADPHKQITGILLTPIVGFTPGLSRPIHEFWNRVYWAIED